MDRKGDFIGCYNGTKFWPLDPRPEDVDMVAVAHALSKICRFNGGSRFHWSIAQHSLLVDKILCEYLGQSENKRIRLIGLLHDASEAYISDLLRPFKKEVIGYKEFEEAVENCILTSCRLTDITDEEWEAVMLADNIALAIESTVLMKPDEQWALMQIWRDDMVGFKQYIQVQNSDYIKGQLLMNCGKLMEELGYDTDWLHTNWYEQSNQEDAIPMLYWDYYVMAKVDENVALIYSDKESLYTSMTNNIFHALNIERALQIGL